MVILGADLSYTRTGLVWYETASNLVVHHQAVSIPTGSKRMLRAAKAFHRVISPHKTDLVVIEDAAYGAPSRTTVVKLAELAGVFKFVLESHGIDYLLTSPTLIKKWVTGKGTAEKHIVARELKRRYGIHFKDDPGNDLSDAAALAAWGANR